MAIVQIFGIKNSSATRAAERFFKERRLPIQSVDLKSKPMAPAEINRFIQKFSLDALIDRESAPFQQAGLAYLKLSPPEWLARFEQTPTLLRLPLVRAANLLAIGHDEPAWKQIAAAQKPV